MPLGHRLCIWLLYIVFHLPICKLELWKVTGIQALISLCHCDCRDSSEGNSDTTLDWMERGLGKMHSY